MSSVSAMDAAGCRYQDPSGGVHPDIVVCGQYGCGANNMSPTQRLQNEAGKVIASLRGVANDSINAVWSKGEIRAYMFLRVLQLANTDPSERTEQEQQIVDFYTKQINDDLVAVDQEAIDLYDQWASNPCGFQVPVGDPNSYLNEEPVSTACHLAAIHSIACLYGSCIPKPPTAEEFTAWAEHAVHQEDLTTWADELTNTIDSLTPSQAESVAQFEYDHALSGVAEGLAYLTVRHAPLANQDASTETAAEQDMAEAWLDGLHDFGGDQAREVIFRVSLETPETFIEENWLSAVDTAIDVAVEEDAATTLLESWDNAIQPAVAAAALLAYHIYQTVSAAEVGPKLRAALDDAQQRHSLEYWASSAEGRSLILDDVVKSTLPDFLPSTLTGAAGTVPGPGPDLPSDPIFDQNSSIRSYFTRTDWNGHTVKAWVRDGWFVQQSDGGPLRYASSVTYVNPNNERWRAWLDGSKFLAERYAVDAGDGYVSSGVNGCGAQSYILNGPNTRYDNECVLPFGSGNTFTKPIAAGDRVEIMGQVRTVGAAHKNSSGQVAWFVTKTPFVTGCDPGTTCVYGPVLILSEPDSDCLTNNTGNCQQSDSLTTSQGKVTLVSPPKAVNDHYTVTGATLLTGPANGVTLNDDLPPNATPQVSLVKDVSHGVLTLNPDGSFTYTRGTFTADSGDPCQEAIGKPYCGPDAFQYKLCAKGVSSVACTIATVNLTVANAPPLAHDVSLQHPSTNTYQAGYTYWDKEGDPEQGTSFEWYVTLNTGPQVALTTNSATLDITQSGLAPSPIASVQKVAVTPHAKYGSWPDGPKAAGSDQSWDYHYSVDGECTPDHLVGSNLTSVCTFKAFVDRPYTVDQPYTLQIAIANQQDGSFSFQGGSMVVFCSFHQIQGNDNAFNQVCKATIVRTANPDSGSEVVVSGAIRKGYGVTTGNLVQLGSDLHAYHAALVYLSRQAPSGTAVILTSAEPSAGGVVICTPNPVKLGENSTCSAVHNPGWRFAGWDVPSCFQDTEPSCILQQVEANRTAAAKFSPLISILTGVTPANSGTVHCSPNPVPQGEPATCTATPALGYAFTGWSGACSGSNAVCDLTSVSAPETVTADFNPTGSNASGNPLVTVQSDSGWHFTSASDPTHPTRGWIPLTGSSDSPAAEPPAGVVLLYGVLSFDLEGGTPGSSANVTIHFPDPQLLPGDTKYWKYDAAQQKWYALDRSGYTVSGDTITLHLTDGGTGDNDGTANGRIVDPGGPAVLIGGIQPVPTSTGDLNELQVLNNPTGSNGGSGQAKPIPTLGYLGLGMLAGLLGLLVLVWRASRWRC